MPPEELPLLDELELPEMELPELELELLELELELPVVAALTVTEAVVGSPKLAAPATEVSEMLKLLPWAMLPNTGTSIVLGDVSPSLQINQPLVGE